MLPLIGLFITTIVEGYLESDATAHEIGRLLGLLGLIAFYPTLAVSVKRCHDRNHSGWFLCLGLLPLVNLWVAIELACLTGTTGPNAYGDDPL
jgi:uncharacterized membrane protein YhaH (DUF805 family)